MPKKDKMNEEPVQEETAEVVEETAEVVEETTAEPAEPSFEELLTAEKDKYLRLAAEYDNYRKRSQKERESLYDMVKADTIANLLPVYDNLERALQNKSTDEAFFKGVEMIMAQLNDIFFKMGVTPIEAVGQKFDANFHNAVMHVDDDTKGENEIVEEFQKGFMLRDKVIRFSMVKVAN